MRLRASVSDDGTAERKMGSCDVLQGGTRQHLARGGRRNAGRSARKVCLISTHRLARTSAEFCLVYRLVVLEFEEVRARQYLRRV